MSGSCRPTPREIAMRCAGLVAHINERWEHEEDAVGHERCVHTDDTRPEPRAIRMRVRGSSNEVGSGGFALPASTPEAARHTDHGLSIGPIGTSPSERDGCGGCPGQKGNTSWQSVRVGSENVRAGTDSGVDTAAVPMTVSTHDRPVEADDRGGRADGDRRRSGRALVAVMKPADLGD